MTTPYSVSTSIGSVSYDNYVNSRITGPLSTNQYPGIIPYHSYGTLTGIRPTPPQFYPSQEPVYSEMNTNAKQQYLRTYVNQKNAALQRALAKKSAPNYINPIPSSMYVNIKKSNAVGQSAYKVNLSNSVPVTTKNYYPSGTRTSLRRARSGGCTAPKKKGALENRSLSNGSVCCWGSLPRQNY